MYGEPLYELQRQSGPPIRLEGAPLEMIQEELERQIPLDKINERREWRDQKLAELYKLKHKTGNWVNCDKTYMYMSCLRDPQRRFNQEWKKIF